MGGKKHEGRLVLSMLLNKLPVPTALQNTLSEKAKQKRLTKMHEEKLYLSSYRKCKVRKTLQKKKNLKRVVSPWGGDIRSVKNAGQGGKRTGQNWLNVRVQKRRTGSTRIIR